MDEPSLSRVWRNWTSQITQAHTLTSSATIDKKNKKILLIDTAEGDAHAQPGCHMHEQPRVRTHLSVQRLQVTKSSHTEQPTRKESGRICALVTMMILQLQMVWSETPHMTASHDCIAFQMRRRHSHRMRRRSRGYRCTWRPVISAINHLKGSPDFWEEDSTETTFIFYCNNTKEHKYCRALIVRQKICILGFRSGFRSDDTCGSFKEISLIYC